MSNITTKKTDRQFTEADLERITRRTFVEAIEYHREMASTNDYLLETARQPATSPLLVLADVQTGGRGRGANRWWSELGALTFSLLIDTSAVPLPTRLLPQASLTLGLAVCEAIDTFWGARDHAVRLKWPNDVYIGDRKVCGILIESPPGQPGKIIVGVGINVNNSVSQAPEELQSTAIALCDVAGHPLELVDVLEHVLVHIADNLQWISGQDAQLRRRWQGWCLLTNRKVRVDVGGHSVTGLCQGIDEDGALLVETPVGVEKCYAGIVTDG